MAADERHRRGALAEKAARLALQKSGLIPVTTNAGFRQGELDIVMRDGDSLVFVEVRYRSSNHFGGGAASVDLRKRRRLVRAAHLFLAAHPAHAHRPCRFDVVAASGPPERPDIHWIKDAFRADDI
ncbi:MAG: YraN family protein [Xanthomonadaceae bacterium]|jgi:putative endonuclease|nr:YraN family protein [Xanthomonadaceae bacterium]